MEKSASKRPKVDTLKDDEDESKACTLCNIEKTTNHFRHYEKGMCIICSEVLSGKKDLRLKCWYCKHHKKRCDFASHQWSKQVVVHSSSSKSTTRTSSKEVVAQCLSCMEEQEFILDDLGENDRAAYRNKIGQVQCEEYWKRDKPIFLHLQKLGSACYDIDDLLQRYKQVALFRYCSFPHVKDLVGSYDIIFLRYETDGAADFIDNADLLQQRKTKGTLKLSLRNEAGYGDENSDQTGDYSQLKGTISLDDNRHSDIQFHRFSFSFQYFKQDFTLSGQLDEVDFGRGWEDAEVHCSNATNSMTLQIINNPRSLLWIPNDNVSGTSLYAQQMRKEIAINNESYRLHGPLRWLRHVNNGEVPQDVINLIHCFIGIVPPNVNFTLEDGDLWLRFDLQYYSSSDDICFAARRKTE